MAAAAQVEISPEDAGKHWDRSAKIPHRVCMKEMITDTMSERALDVIAAPGWSAVYVGADNKEFVWPLIAWYRPSSTAGPLLVGLALSLDGRAVVPAEQIDGFKCYLPPAEWVGEPTEPPAAQRRG
jgi:hypothetical protein